MVKLLRGFTQANGTLYHAGQCFSAKPEQEAHLVSLGAAEYVSAAPPVAHCETNVHEASVNTGETETAQCGSGSIEGNFIDKAQLMAMKMDELRELAEDMEIDHSKYRRKEDLVNAICRICVGAEPPVNHV